MNDFTKKYLINLTGVYFNLDTSINLVNDQSKLEQFLDNDHCSVLCATIQKQDINVQIQFQTEIISFANRMVIFFKNRPSRLDETNVYEIVQVIVLQGSPAASLYHALHNVFTPLLLQESKKSNIINNLNLQRQLSTFQSSLRSAAIVADGADGVTALPEQNSLSVILTLEHEVDYWNSIANTTKSSEQRASSILFRDILTPLARDFSMLDALPLIEVEDALEGAHNVLDDLWRHEPPYSRTRMQHLMNVIASDVIRCITCQFTSTDVWHDDYILVNDQLVQSVNVGKKWNAACTHLTQLFWPNYSLHPWTGDSYTPQNLVDLVTRLEEVVHLRAVHRQLTQLLSRSELDDLHTSEMFKSFSGVNILECGPYSEITWQGAVKRFLHLLQPAEQRVAEKLKVYLANVSSNTRQLLYEFQRYSNLIDRPMVKKILLAERQNLLTSLGQYVQQLTAQLANYEQIESISDTPRIVTELSFMKQLESKALLINQTIEKSLDDVPGHEDVKLACSEFLTDLKHQHSELFDSWTRELTVQLNTKGLSLRETDPVVQFLSNDLMQVNYSSRLVTLVREYRQLVAMGYRISPNIEQMALHAKKFLKHAKALEQVANFHNTIGDRMIECQRPMMLADALRLARLVQQEEVVSWIDVQLVEKYIESLRSAVDQLSRNNNMLASHHEQLLKMIASLTNTDLIKHLQKWKDAAKNMRDIMNQIERQGFTNMHSWKLEIDRKLSVEFERQYQQSLETVHLYLPEIYADLIYRDSIVQFSPDLGKLREKYNLQLHRFLDLPKNFRGVSDIVEGSVFAEIVGRCGHLYTDVEKRTDELFEQLQAVAEHWRSWLSIGVLDVSQLETWQHWDLNFRASKTFGQEVAKLPSTEERIGCFIISLSCLRSDLEHHNRTCWTQLTSSLYNSIAQDVVRLQQYINTSTAALTRQPSTAEQIGEAYAVHSDIVKQMPEMLMLLDETQNKNKTLANWTRERVESVGSVQAAWERLQSLIDNYQHLMEKQMEAFRSTMNTACSNLNGEIERFSLYWQEFRARFVAELVSEESLKNMEQYLVTLKEKRFKWDELSKQKEKVLTDCKQFGIQSPEFVSFEQIQLELEKEEKVWTLFEEFHTDLDQLGNNEWIVFRKKCYKLDEFISTWQKRLESPDLNGLTTKLLQELRKYESVVPSLKYVRGDDFTERHWSEVYSLLGMPVKTVDMLTLHDFLAVSDKLLEHTDVLRAICKRAASEIVVRQALAELDQWEILARFTLIAHVDAHSKNVMLVKDFKDILNKIGDNQSLLQSVKNTADYESYSERATLWETKLFDLDHYLCVLSQIQRKWAYLEPIFGSGTLRQDRARFERLDRDFRHLLGAIERDPRVTSLARYPNIRSTLDVLQDQLTRCQNSLENFLTEKRLKFPRFLFLGDDDLLEILGQSSREQIIQAHLKKLFAGIHSVRMDTDAKSIVAMCSSYGEIVPLLQPVNVECPVEDWLNALVMQMRITLQRLLVQCLAEGQQADPMKYPSQILCLSDAVVFTSHCEQGIKSSNLSSLLLLYKKQVKSSSSTQLTDDASSRVVMDLKLKALMLDTIYHLDVIEELINNNVTSLTDWHWQKQLRFYSSDGTVTVCMANACINYAFEYLGNPSKLVRTPLVDKCFLALTQGIHLGMGGNPYGPAGTGKTESVKALGSLLGRQVLVFNCDEGVDAIAMARILAGLVRSGAWGCFDEFNRLDEATLSAISMHIHPIQVALRTGNKTVTLHGQSPIDVDPHCGIFVTLNPAGGGYQGRNQLPANLKQLFRPVVMRHPDHEQIARTLLKCDGYQYADLIGRKLVEVFKMCDSLFTTQQQHYDWGLRALRTVLNTCGTLMASIVSLSKNDGYEGDDVQQREMRLAVRSLRVNTLSKLTFVDGQRFDSVVEDVFRNVPFENVGHDSLVSALEDSCLELGLQVNDRQISKCVELYEQLKQRMGVTIVGPSGSGKSTLRKILLRALNKLNQSVLQHVFNPKAMSRIQLLGQIDLNTRQWSDGVLTLCAQQVYVESAEAWSWVVCDGDVDPDWIESLNSVLDDNRLLTLPSGWRIQFGPNVNFLFETHDLCYASPATISRMGIILLGEDDVSISDIINNWLSWQPENTVLTTTHLLNEYFYKAIEWMKVDGELILPCSYINIVQTGLSQLRHLSNSKSQFTVALLSVFCGLLTESTRNEFAQQLFEWTGEHCPDDKSIRQCFYNIDRDLIDVYRSDLNNNIQLDNNQIELPLVLTGQVRHVVNVLDSWLSMGSEEHFLMVGPHGSAKSLILNYLVRKQQNMDITTIYCSGNVTPQYVLHKLVQHCIIVSSSRGRVFRPKRGRLVLHFKGLHLLKTDQWGTNMLIAFLHQFITYGGLFDANLEWVGVESVIVVGTLSSTQSLSTRFTSIVRIHTIDEPGNEDLKIIYESYAAAVLRFCLSTDSAWLVKSKISKLVTTLLSIYDETKNTFSAMQQRHYVFSLHNLTEWCTSLARYKNILTDSITDFENTLLEIIFYEAFKIFGDKLAGENDQKKFEMILNKILQSHWGKSTLLNNIKNVFYAPPEFSKNNVHGMEFSPLVRLNADEWTCEVKKGLIRYERDYRPLDLQIIPELLLMTSAISRVVSHQAGCVLLAGRSGVGRHSAARIVSSLYSAKLMTPVFNGSDLAQFNNDLKLALQIAGIDGEQVYFMLEDYVLRDPVALDTVNTLLAAGEVPGLYSSAELDSLVAGLKDDVDSDNFEGNAIQYFVQRVRNNLHLIFCVEIDGSVCADIFDSYPVLCQRCTIVWQPEWSAVSMVSVPNLLLKKYPAENESNIVVVDKFYSIHKQVKQLLALPRRYVAFVNTYINLHSTKRIIIQGRQIKLQAGIDRLTEARSVVADLKMQATKQREILAEKQMKANAALDMITETMQNANVHKVEMETLKTQTEKENQQLLKRKEEIELELAQVEPVLQEARAAVGNIKTESLAEIRSLRAPPDVIRDILEGVLRLMGTQDTSWNSMKTFLAKRGVKEDIRSFDAAKISSDSRQAVERLITARRESFDPKTARRASVAAAPLAAWVLANVEYSKVVEKTRPLEREQYRLQKNLQTAENQIGELSTGLADVDAQVAALKIQLSTYTKEAAEIEIKLTAAEDKLHTAEGLVSKLNEEYDRWKVQLNELANDLNCLSAKCLLAAAYITYLSDEETEDLRRVYITKWTASLGTECNFCFEEFLSSEREQLQWQTEGLLSDKLSIHNAIVILKTQINVLLLDPTSFATKWLRTHLKNRTVEVVTQNAPRFTTSLELAVRFGKILVIEEIDYISPILIPLLRKEYVYQGERRLVSIGNKLVDCHDEFSLYLSSRNVSLEIPADIRALLSVVSFTMTNTSLTEQLLHGAVRQEYPELETRLNELLQKREDLQEQHYNLQNRLLEELASATGDILQNHQLLSSLNETKASSIAIEAALKESTTIQQQLHVECDVLKPLSSFGSRLYFATTDLIRLNPMYSVSVAALIKLFLNSLSAATVDNYSQVQNTFLHSVYHHVSRGMFKTDRLPFALHLCRHMFPERISDAEWDFFLGHGKSVSGKEEIPDWIPEFSVHEMVNLQTILPNVYDALKLQNKNNWETFMKIQECELNFPAFCNLTDFQKVIVVRILRPDRLYSAVQQCVLHLTGMKNLSSRILYLSQLLQETTSAAPVLLITAPGADPSMELRDLAAASVGCDNYVEIAMGIGQESSALNALDDCVQHGKWLCLKNLHLVSEWSFTLSQKIQTLIEPHSSFRLWLVTEPLPIHKHFSAVLIRSCTKLTYEAPPGIKNNILRSYATWGKDYIQKQNTKGARYIFSLAYVHALLQERRVYIPQGWTKWYEFNDVDLHTAANLCLEIKTTNNVTLWTYARGLCADAVYGGRIDEPQDDLIMRSYLKLHLSDETVIPLPNSANFQAYIDCINQLPETDKPASFGLPVNIDRAWQRNAGAQLITNLKLLIHSSDDDSVSSGNYNRGVISLLTFWKRLHKDHDLLRMTVSSINETDNSPLSVFATEEKRFSILILQFVHRSLSTISKIIRGSSRPTDKDTLIINSLSAYQTPYDWLSFWKGPKEPFKYVQLIVDKALTISKWTSNINEIFFKSPVTLSSMFRPKMFFRAFKQHTARSLQIAVDDLYLENEWIDKRGLANSVSLAGLLIEGALFDGRKLIPCSADGETITSVPPCHIAWKQKKGRENITSCIQIQLYSSYDREDYLETILLPSDVINHDQWLLAGVSLFSEY